MTAVRTLTVAEDDSDIRLDRWFRRHFPELGHGRLEKLLRTGQIRIDGGRAKSSTRLAAGQLVRVPPFGETEAVAPRAAVAPPDPRAAARLQASVLHIDDDVIVINKPPGLAVQGGTGLTHHLDAMLDALRLGAKDRPRLVHRLDKDTSGVLLLGRSPRAAARLAETFRGKEANKTYWALTAGVPRPRRGRIDLAIAKGRNPSAAGEGERVRVDAAGAKRAVTYYSVLEAAARRAAWLALRPVTGRTHQLRVHCAAIGTPVLGDGKYGGRIAFITGVPGGRSLMLHAREIEMPHPSGGRLRVAAPLPEAMRTAWRFFGFDPEAHADPFAGLEI